MCQLWIFIVTLVLSVFTTNTANEKRVFLDGYCLEPSYQHGKIKHCSHNAQVHRHGEKCTLQCDSGYHLEDGKDSVDVMCGANGKWSNVSCINVDPHVCGAPPTVQDGVYVCSGSVHKTGSSCHLYCSRRHQVSGNEQIFCDDKNQWGSPGSCIESQCPPPPKIQMGNYVCGSVDYPHGTTCRLQCDGGFRPVTNNVNITCTQNETWTASTACMEGCLPGTFSKRNLHGELSCEICAKGTYQPNVDQPTCLACPGGWSTLLPGATNVDSCASLCHVGTFSTTGTEPCHLCHKGTYQNVTGAQSCHPCPVGLTTNSVGSTNIADCI